MVRLLGADCYHVQLSPGKFIIVTELVRVDEDSSGSGAHSTDGDEREHVAASSPRNRSSSAHRAHNSAGSGTSCEQEKGHHPCCRDQACSEDERESEGSDFGDADDGQYIERVIHFQCGNMFDIQNIACADLVMMETDIPADSHDKLRSLLDQMQPGSRILTYLDLRKLWANSHLGFQQIEANKHHADRYPTSWSVQRGHHFYLWRKVVAAA